MITLYEGNDIYKIILSSGKELELTLEEYQEIEENSDFVDELKKEVKYAENALNEVLESIESQNEHLLAIEDIINKLDKYVDFIKDKKIKDEYLAILKELEGNKPKTIKII